MTDTEPNVAIDLGKYELGWSDEEDYVFKPQKGLNEDIIREMSFMKKEPEWMLDFRLRSYKIFESKPMPSWGGDTSGIDFDNIYYYIIIIIINISVPQDIGWDWHLSYHI